MPGPYDSCGKNVNVVSRYSVFGSHRFYPLLPLSVNSCCAFQQLALLEGSARLDEACYPALDEGASVPPLILNDYLLCGTVTMALPVAIFPDASMAL
jgi:hypothetical protein